MLDAIPLNWAAQAFDLNSVGTWLVTLILVVASVGAMLGFEVTRGHPKRRGLLAAVVAVGYLALLGLRTEFLTTVASESFLVAFLQAAMLTAISAGLVLCGAAVMARTRSPSLSRPARPRNAPGRPLKRPTRRSGRPPKSCSVTSAHSVRCCCPGPWARPPRTVSTAPNGQPPSSGPSVSCSRRRDRLCPPASRHDRPPGSRHEALVPPGSRHEGPAP